MKRKDTFFGLHFDFHANRNSKNIGGEFDPTILERICEEVRPDFIQCDTKGHPGLASYRTELGNAAPGLAGDPLKEWRKITAKHNILLFSHYSGIWDMDATSKHPEWCAVDANGKRMDQASVFGGYADGLEIPQLIEIASKYKVNGAWIDGECWYLEPDYSPMADKAFFEKTGKHLKDVSKEERLAFYRKSFFGYVDHYIRAVKAKCPGFEITSNWLNTSWAPDDICITDYISGDLSGLNGLDSARFDGRLAAAFRRNWDLMSWGISFPVHYVKSALQLCQEAASVISLGGGYQIYNMQSPENVCMDEWAIGEWAKVASFVRERQPYLQGSSLAHDIGILYSKDANYAALDQMGKIFWRENSYNNDLYGLLLAILDTGRSAEMVLEERLEKTDLAPFKMLVVTDALVYKDETKKKLLDYVREGGQLLLAGANTAKFYATDLGLEVENPLSDPTPDCFITDPRFEFECRAPYAVIHKDGLTHIVALNEARIEGDLNIPNPPPSIQKTGKMETAFGTMEYGKGLIGLLPITLGNIYFNDLSFEIKRFFQKALSAMRPTRLTIDRPSLVDAALAEKEGRTFVSLTNLLGDHRSPRTKSYDYIPPVFDVHVRLLTESKPKKIVDLLEKTEIPFAFDGKTASFKVAKVEINSLFEVVY